MAAKYGALTQFLKALPAKTREVTLKFIDIERIIQAPLPNAAYLRRERWTNDGRTARRQASAWRNASYRVAEVDPMETELWVRLQRSM